MKTLIYTLALLFSLSSWASEVDLKNSKFTWNGKKVTGEHTGHINLKSATVNLDPSGKVSKAQFVMDMNSITVTDLQGEWAEKFLKHIKSDDFFNVPKFPTAKLEITNDNGKEAKGQLTIKGKTHPVKVSYTKDGNNVKGTLKFDRTKFGMTYKSGNFFKDLGDKMIYDEVSVAFNLQLK